MDPVDNPRKSLNSGQFGENCRLFPNSFKFSYSKDFLGPILLVSSKS